MSHRINFARFLLRLSGFIRSLPVVVLRPADQAEFSRQVYDQISTNYTSLNNPDNGLTDDEQECWQMVARQKKTVLILGAGGGREVVFFARQGLEVTGVDFSEGMLARARQITRERKLHFQELYGNIANIDIPDRSFDLVWFSMYLYSTVLGRKRRITMLQHIRKGLRKNGVVVCSFHRDTGAAGQVNRFERFLKKLVAHLSFGNTAYENGDFLFCGIEFRHAFSAREHLKAEFVAGGFESVCFAGKADGDQGWVILSESSGKGCPTTPRPPEARKP